MEVDLKKRKFEPKKAEKREIIYYTDELTDEFSTAVIEPRFIGGDFKYVSRSVFKKFTHFFWYRVVAFPIAFLYSKIKFGQKIENAKVLKEARKTGYFLYGNHTQDIGDAFMPNMIDKLKDKYVIVHPNNVSMPFIGRVAVSLGAIPLPDDREAFRNFLDAIKTRIEQKKAVVIYPEAHIWPYYTGIRPFPDTSFAYPIKYGVPAYCFTNTYQKRKFSKNPKIVTYVDGPFFPNAELPLKDSRKELRDRIYETMRRRAENSDFVKIRYIKKES